MNGTYSGTYTHAYGCFFVLMKAVKVIMKNAVKDVKNRPFSTLAHSLHNSLQAGCHQFESDRLHHKRHSVLDAKSGEGMKVPSPLFLWF